MAFSLTGQDSPYVIGEIGFNHNGELETAQALIEKLADAGADCAKLQLFRTDYLLSPHVDQDVIKIFRRHQLSREQYLKCQDTAESAGIDLAASVFDRNTLGWYAVNTDAPFIKIASGDLTFKRLLTQAGKTGQPIILSVGGGTMDEIKRAIEWIDPVENQLTLLHCISEYPADNDRLHLRRIQHIQQETGLPVGFSDHSRSTVAPRIAAALGAVAWERHVTLDNQQDGPEHAFSLETDELKRLIPTIEEAASASPDDISNEVDIFLGQSTIELTDADHEFRQNARRSLMANRPIPAGALLIEDLVRELRPGTGLPAGRIDDCLKLPVPRPVEPLHMIPY